MGENAEEQAGWEEHAQPVVELQRVVGGGRGEGVGGGGGRGPSRGSEFVRQQSQSPYEYEEVIINNNQSSIPDILTEDPAPAGDGEVCPGQI